MLADKEGTGKTKLLRLFQPDSAGRRLFGILVSSLNATSTLRRILKIVLGSLRTYWWGSLLALVLACLAYLGSGSWLAAILTLILSVPLSVGIGIYVDFTRGIVGNSYGLCKGMTTAPRDGPALTQWLHKLIQDAAGLPMGEPLTFGHLWTAPGFPPKWLELSEEQSKAVRSIDLQMFTTNVTHGRPYALPHIEATARLFFRVEELEQYLPKEVAEWFVAHALEYTEARR